MTCPRLRPAPTLTATLLSAALLAAGCGKAPPRPQAAAPQTPPPGNVPTFVDQGPARSPDAVVVEVDGAKLLQGQLDAQIRQVLGSQGMGNLPPESMGAIRSQLEQRVIERFVGQNVLLAEARRQNVQADPQAVSNAMAEIKTKVPPGMTLEQALQSAGMDMAAFEKELQQDLMVQQLLSNRTARLPKATDAEVAAFYKEQPARFEAPETVRARHILVKCETDADAATLAQKQKLAEDLHGQLTNGADFATLAKQHSDCPSKERGGDLGPFGRGNMVKEFEDAAFSQATNVIGPVVKTPFGYHIIQVTAHDQARTQSLDEVKGTIASHLEGQKQREAVNAYVAELKGKSKIAYANPPPAAPATAPIAVPAPAP